MVSQFCGNFSLPSLLAIKSDRKSFKKKKFEEKELILYTPLHLDLFILSLVLFVGQPKMSVIRYGKTGAVSTNNAFLLLNY